MPLREILLFLFCVVIVVVQWLQTDVEKEAGILVELYLKSLNKLL